jgi:hypothetical protein
MRKHTKKQQQPKIGDKVILDNQEYVISGLKTRKYTEVELIVYLEDNKGEFQHAVGITENISGTSYNSPKDLKYFSLESLQHRESKNIST